MGVIIKKFWSEPVYATTIPTILLATASGIWANEWLAFGAAATAAIGAFVTRQNVAPTNPKKDA